MYIFDAYIVTCTVSAENLILPDEATATNQYWEKWAESYLRNPTGQILQIRIGLTQSKPPVKLVVCTSPKRAYYWRTSQEVLKSRQLHYTHCDY